MKNNADIIKKFKQKAARDKALRKNIRTRNVLGFLLARGLLFTNQKIVPKPKVKIKLADYLWVGQKVEPRVLELLPALILRFPTYILNRETMPDDLKRVIENLKGLKQSGPSFQGHTYQKIQQWAYFELQDKRTKSMAEKKICKSVRLSPATIAKLATLSKLKKMSMTEAIEWSVAAV